MDKFWEVITDIEIILITGYGDIDCAAAATKMGAYDYITKPFKLERLKIVIEKAYQRVCLKRENRLLRHHAEKPDRRRIVRLLPGRFHQRRPIQERPVDAGTHRHALS